MKTIKCEQCSKHDKQIKALEEMIKVQSSNGNWNYDGYMFGMANGMIFALSLFTGKAPKYLSKPKKFLSKDYQAYSIRRSNGR